MSNHSIKLGLALVILFFVKSLFAQFPNLPGLNTSGCIPHDNPFQFDNMRCIGWKKSHGTPNSMNTASYSGSNNYINVTAGKKFAPNYSTNSWISEGYYYEYPFKKDKIYKISFYYRIGQGSNNGNGKVEECFVKLANGLTEEQTPNTNPTSINYTYQVPTEEQVIFSKYNEETVTNNSIFDANGWVYFEKFFTPDKDYGQLWISLKDYDSEEQESQYNLAAFHVGGIQFQCISDPPIDILYQNTTVPLFSGAINSIRTSQVVNTHQIGHTVFEAGNSISLEGSFRAYAGAGTSFTAMIKPTPQTCSAYEEDCSEFFVPGSPFITSSVAAFNSANYAIGIPTAVIANSIYSIPSKGYNILYNAWKAELFIYNRWGNLMHQDVIEVEDPYIGHTRPLMWNVGNFPDVVVVLLKLYGCDGTTTQYLYDITVIAKTVATENSSSENFETLEKIKTNLQIFPNPSNGHINIKIDAAGSTEGRLAIYDMQGRLLRTLAEGTLNAEVYSYDFDQEPSGIYMVQLITNEGVHTQKVVIAK